MPRVSAEHREARHDQILDAARRCFVRDGFHAASMQDVQAEAGLSAGALYLYFKSKEEIVEAIAAGSLARWSDALDGILRSDDLPPLDLLLGQVLGQLLEHNRAQPVIAIAVQVWGEALRAPRLAARFAEKQGHMRGLLTRVVAHYQAHGRLDPSVQAEHIARVLTALVMGFMVQYAVLGEADLAAFTDGLRALLTAGSPAPPDEASLY